MDSYVADNGTRYEIHLRTDSGSRLLVLTRLAAFEITPAVNNIGGFSITLSGQDAELLGVDTLKFWQRILFWRKPRGGHRYLEFQGIVTDMDERTDDKGATTLTVSGVSTEWLLSNWHVMYPAGSTYAEGTDSADDLMKKIVRYNLMADNATVANGRARPGGYSSTYLEVAADTGSGSSLSNGFAYKNVLDTLRELSEISRSQGTEVFFRLEWATAGKLRFVTATGQPGLDRTTNRRLSFGLARGNLRDPRLFRSVRDEINVAYGLGQGEGEARYIQDSDDDERTGLSLFAVREGVAQSNEGSQAAVLAAARALRAERKPLQVFTGQLLSTPGSVYGKDWNFGDKVKIDYRARQFSSIVRAVNIRVAGGEETITAGVEALL